MKAPRELDKRSRFAKIKDSENVVWSNRNPAFTIILGHFSTQMAT